MYQVQLSPSAQRQLKKLTIDLRKSLAEAIDGLAINPRPVGITKLQGEENVYRIRVGKYRILYEIQDDVLIVLVIKIGHRREVYRS